VRRAALVLALCSACGTFQDEAVVLDLRIIGMAAEPPEQVVTFDVNNPPEPIQLLEQLVPTKVCALIADGSFDRPLSYSFTLCLTDDGRCDSTAEQVLASGTIDDPDITVPEPQLCATVNPDGNLLAVLLESLEDDTLKGLGGVYYDVVLRVGSADFDPSLDLYGDKTLRVMPKIPDTITANHNPTMDHFEASIDGAPPVPLQLGRCIEQTAPFQMPVDTKVRLTPIESPDARETYVAPTIDGMGRTFTEALTYQWLVGAGAFTANSTGGPRDISGNPAPLFTDYKTPDPEDIPEPRDLPLWIIQRDERLGVAWYESCVRVMP